MFSILMVLFITGGRAADANLWLFDMGRESSPLWPGFARVTPETAYSTEQGYGWLTQAKNLRAYVATNIDALAIDETRRQAFHGFWREHRPDPDPPADVSIEERQRGYIAAEVHCSDDRHPWSQPDAGADRQRIELFATPGAQEQASFAVYALRDLEEVTFSLGDMHSDTASLPATAFTLGLVQFAPWHAGRRDSTSYAIRECLILPLRPTFVGGGTCKRFWITFETPKDAVPGVYRGTIEIQARNAPPTSLELAIRVVPVHQLGVSNTIRGNSPSDMAPIELGLVKYPQPNWAMMFPDQLETMRRTGKRLWAYNFSRSRFSLGWFCWRHGITRASYESGVYANGQPGNVFEIETMPPMGLPLSMTRIAPTVNPSTSAK